ncbi:RHS repeat-associated core domain-containing protein [Embleya sp. NPDC127516]|uniref:RHS repeat-associated core domain-containing protein n=1 Tax=Embleya sp. NPDC127516 TaxID=3363990 RepID=UPI0037FFE218
MHRDPGQVQRSTELVKGADGLWKAAADGAERIERLTGADNGDNDGEHWKVTTADGTQYFFGLNKLPGAGAQRTNSAWTVPIFGNNDGEECHKNAFADSWCQQGWRWNLDYVVDPRGNAMTYFYETETNHYGRNGDVSTGKGTSTPYIRGGWTTRIEYGHRSDSLFSAKAPAVVYFDVAERCLPTGTITCSDAQFTKDNAKSWPDVPVDLNCASGAECKVLSPSFWTRKRLTTIRTQVLSGGTHRDVDAWAFEQQFPDSGDGHFPLWLAAITRTGKAGATDVVMPPVTFGSEQLENRVDGKEHIAPFWRRRVNRITTETGSTTQVAYSARDCVRSALPDPATNTKRCYPVNWSPDGADQPILDWFHKYVATQVLQADNTGGGRVMQTDYEYVGTPAWLKSTDEFTKPAERTYNDYRGYAALKVRSGGAGDKRGLVETRYFRGIPGAKVADSEGITADDAPILAGSVRETINYNGDGGTVLAAVAKDYWVSDPIASRARPDLPDLTSVQTGTKTERTRAPLSDGGWRRSKITRTFDIYGMPVQEDSEGDLSVTGDEQCLRTEYARNTTDWLVSHTSRSEIVTVGCSTTPTRPRDVLSDNRTFYDGATSYETPPTKGLSTSGTEITASGTGRQTNLRIEYDAYGRARKAWNVEDQLTITDYAGNAGELPNTSTVTNPLGQTIKQTFDIRRALVVTSEDVNKVRTDYEYDALGRVVKVWAPGWDKETHSAKPTKEYSYLVRADGPVAVSTKHLIHNGNYLTNIDLYDSLLRPRQTQVPTQGGRIVTERWYDSLGRNWRAYSGYFASGAPETSLVAADDTKVVASTETVFDGAGRPTDVISKKYGTETVRTSTLHDGERTTTVPPAGGTASTAVLDAFGRTSELIEYTLPDRKGPQSTLYEYTARGDMKKVVDPAGSTWTHDYDFRGNDTHSIDPDKGESRREYDTSDRVVKTTSARGGTLSQTYDALGRQRQLKSADTVLAEWEFDTAPGGVGRLAASTRWVDGGAYKTAITGYNTRGQSNGTTITLPADAGTGLTGPFTWQYAYNPETGLPTGVRHPALGGLPAETVTTGYDAFGRVQSTGSSLLPYVGNTTYDPLDRITQTEMGAFGKKLIATNVWDQHTGSLLSAQTDQESTKSRLGLTEYGYDPTQNVTRIADTNGQGTTVPDVQCFAYDGLRRMTQAWTATDNCAQQQPASGTNGTVGGVDPYWHTYTFDAVGSRLQETIHDTTGDTTKDLTRKYTYPAAGENKPRHALTKVVTEAAAGTTENTYEYDAAGNTTKRKISGKPEQNLDWTAEGRLGKVLDGDQESNYVYDAEGRRILKRDPAGTTAYLVNGTELRRSAGGTLTGTRYYAHADKTVAVRTGNKVSFLLNDHHGTAGTSVDNTTQAVTRRKTLPFGGPRGAQPAPGGWPDDKGFLGKTVDSTGLVNIGAREYDTGIGRFVSVDPIMDLARPEQMQGYAYASNRPTTSSDPTGLADRHTNTPTPPAACPTGGGANDRCGNGLIDINRRLTADGSQNGRPETIYDERGVPHDLVNPGNDTNANAVHAIITADLTAAGDAYDPQTRSGYVYYHQAEGNANGLKGLIADGPLHVVTGTTADFVLVKWENGNIKSVSSYDATGTQEPSKDLDDIEKEIRRKLSIVARGKFQAQNVIYLAADRTQGEAIARRFSGDQRVRVVSTDGYDSRPTVRVPFSNAHAKAKKQGMRGGAPSIAVLGGAVAALSFGTNWYRYGFQSALKSLIMGFVDPINLWGNRPQSYGTES